MYIHHGFWNIHFQVDFQVKRQYLRLLVLIARDIMYSHFTSSISPNSPESVSFIGSAISTPAYRYILTSEVEHLCIVHWHLFYDLPTCVPLCYWNFLWGDIIKWLHSRDLGHIPLFFIFYPHNLGCSEK